MNTSEPVLGRLDLDEVIRGLVDDLKLLRAGQISTRDAKCRAMLAHEIMRGIRLVLDGRKFIEEKAQVVIGTDAGA